ncbi:MAG: SRPBCC family protein [Mucilaginibacter sp.]
MKYTTAKYSVAIDVAGPVNDVFAHVIDLSRWWPEEFEGESIGLGSLFVLKTGEGHYSRNKVVEFDPGKKLAWRVTESLRATDNFDWTGTTMSFDLTPRGDKTAVSFTYDGVVLESEADRLVQICDMTLKDLFCKSFTIDNKSFTTTMEVSKPPGVAFKRITADVAKWWGGNDLKGSTANLDDEFTIHHPGAHYSKQRLVEVIPNEKVVWQVTESTLYWLQNDKHEWENTKMIFEIAASGNKTVLHFTHVGLVPGKECYTLCHKGWNTVIKDYLFHLIEDEKPHFG